MLDTGVADDHIEPTTRIHLRVDTTIKARLKALADAAGVSINTLAGQAILRDLDAAEGAGDDQ